jgi:hypothetical protein
VVAAVALVLALGGRATAGLLGPGDVLFTTVPGVNTSYNFSKNPVPANALFPGSDPFTGTVALQGIPIDPSTFGSRDTILHLPPDGDPVWNGGGSRPTQLWDLTLKSTQPVTITGNHGATSSLYNVFVTLNTPKGSGDLSFTRTGPTDVRLHDGDLNVFPMISFVPVGGGKGFSLSSHEWLDQAGSATWVEHQGLQGTLVFHSTCGGLSIELSHTITQMPEPAGLCLASLGSLGLLGWGWRRRRA